MQKKLELNYMNAIACLAVILIHVFSLGISSLAPASWQAFVIYIPWKLAGFVVPMFLYTGAVKMAKQFENKPITLSAYFHYILQRIRKIYLPYVLWVMIYYGCFLVIHYVRGEAGEFLSYLALGNLSSPFYYILIIMQFYLLMPLWVWLVKHCPAFLGIAGSLLITVCMQQFTYLLSLAGIQFLYADRIFPTYLFFWVLGLYVGKYYDAWAAAFARRHWQIPCFLLILACVLVSYLQYASGVYLFNTNDIKLGTDFLSIALVHAIALWMVQAKPAVQHVFQKIYESSFFVYLSHCLFLTLGTVCFQRLGIYALSLLLPLRAAVCYTLPFAAYRIYKRIFSHFPKISNILG